MNTPVKVLIVEDSEDDAKLALRALRGGGFEPTYRRVQTAAELKTALAGERWDAVISDFKMPGFSGMDALKIVRSAGLDIPFILVSGTIGEETAVEAMKAGASDYVMKQNLARLAPALERELNETQMSAAHRQTQRELVESEQRLRTIIETEPECVKVVSSEGALLEMNAAGLAMLEADSLAAVRSRTLLDFVAPEYRAAFAALHRRVIRGESGMLEFEAIGLKGGRRWLETHAAPLAGANGDTPMLLGVTRDITERKRATEEIQFKNTILKTQQETSLDAILVVGENEDIISYNQQFIDLWRLSPQLVSARMHAPVLQSVADQAENSEAFVAQVQFLYAHRNVKSHEEVPLKDGRIVDRYSAPIAGADGKYYGRVWYFRDITERKNAEKHLVQMEGRYRGLLEAAPDAMVVVNQFEEIVLLNLQAEKQFGYRHNELVGQKVKNIIPDGFAERLVADGLRSTADALAQQIGTGIELTGRRKDGSDFPIEIMLSPLENAEGILVTAAIRDITKRKAAEARIAYLIRTYAVLSDINSLIVRVNNRDVLFKEACRIAVEKGGFHVALIAIGDRNTMTIASIALAGMNGRFLSLLKERFSLVEGTPLGNPVMTQAIMEKRAFVINDLQSDAEVVFHQQYAEAGILSAAILPLIVADEAVGAFALYANEREFFHEEELKLLTELADDIAYAIDHIDKQARLDYLAYYDVLTGLANRSLFLDRVTQYIRSAVSGGHKLAVFLIDIERFKNINDSLGRPAGDALLRQVAEWLTLDVKDANLVARVGPDQFVTVLPEVKQDGGGAQLLEKWIKALMDHPFQLNDAIFRVAVKVGAAVFPGDGADADTLFRNAEAALKKAKASGERYMFYSRSMSDFVAGNLTLENQLRQALEKEEFVLHYQPKVNLLSGKLTGVEALIRWNDPRTGLVPPGRFIPILEEIGLIYDVGRWALRQAIAVYLRWRIAGLPAVRIAVNVSALQLRNRGFIDEIRQAIGVDAQAAAGLELELTESLIMADVKGTIASLQAIRDMGVSIAIDDFGTGFSSLSYLARLPVDTLKIDRSFVVDMTAGPQGLALVSTIITLAHSLKLKVVAEGVETEEQRRLLHLLNCDEMQGFLFSKPVPVEIFESRFLAPAAGAADA